jgi:hypothetical protein
MAPQKDVQSAENSHGPAQGYWSTPPDRHSKFLERETTEVITAAQCNLKYGSKTSKYSSMP